MIFWDLLARARRRSPNIARMTKATSSSSRRARGHQEIKQVMSDADRAASTGTRTIASSTKFTAATKRSRMPIRARWKKAAFG